MHFKVESFKNRVGNYYFDSLVKAKKKKKKKKFNLL